MTLPCHGSNTGSTPVRIVALWAHVHLLIIIMLNAIDNIKATYDYDQCEEIVDHGCQSGVCSQHIYHGDTIKFFDTYADEVTNYIKDALGIEVLSETLEANDGNLDMYKNDLTWTFIELVAMQVVDEREEQKLEDDETIGSYFNPPRSMSDSRYAQV